MSPQEASAAISGANAYGKLKFESGIHRVQVSFIPNLFASGFLLFPHNLCIRTFCSEFR